MSHVIANMLQAFGTTAYVCPLCDEWACCAHKPVCDYEGDCPDCSVEKPRVAEALGMSADTQLLVLEVRMRHKGDMLTEVSNGYWSAPKSDGEHLSHKQGYVMRYAAGECPRCATEIDVPLVYGYLGRSCPKCGVTVCVHCRVNEAPGGRSRPFVVRTYCRKDSTHA